MNVETISTIIQTLGFPIVVAAALFWYVNKQEERHHDEMTEMRQTLENNTEVLTGLKEIITMFIGKIKGDE